jgi:putative transcriptional regulator
MGCGVMARTHISSEGRKPGLYGGAPRTALWALVLVPLLILCRGSSAAPAPGAKPINAILITARSDLTDPDFANSVVLVMNNLGPAPVGLIINRPTPVPVSHLFPDLKQLAHVPDKVYFGGPVEFETVWFLVRAAKPPEHAFPTCDGVYLSADKRLLLQLLARAKPMEGLRLFIGHAGWAPGQLEQEIASGSWHLKRADANAIFSGKSEHPWPSSQEPKHGA